MNNSNSRSNPKRWNISIERNTQVKPATRTVSKDRVAPPPPARPSVSRGKSYKG